jgi:hypothetical protein
MFSACSRRPATRQCVLTGKPRIMVVVEAFLKEYISTDIVVWRGHAMGPVGSSGVLDGEQKVDALRKAFSDDVAPEVSLGDRKMDYPFTVEVYLW